MRDLKLREMSLSFLPPFFFISHDFQYCLKVQESGATYILTDWLIDVFFWKELVHAVVGRGWEVPGLWGRPRGEGEIPAGTEFK